MTQSKSVVKRSSKLISCLSIALLAACSTPPKVNKNWLAQNCLPLPEFEPDSCNSWSNCQTVSESICSCSHQNGNYHGQLLEGNQHGLGSYTLNNITFAGYWYENKRYCGVESDGDNFAVYKLGKITERGNSTAWADAFAGALIIGTAGYLAGQSGYSGYQSPYTTSDFDWDWDYQPGNGQWVCRGIQTGQYADLGNCQFDVQDDDRWP